MTSFPTQQEWLDQSIQIYHAFLKALSRFGVEVSPDLRVTQDDCLFCYYDPSKKVIAFSIPDPQTPKGRLAWHFYRNIVAAPTLEDLFEFARITLPRIVAHEVAHHLRDWYGTATGNDWVEEHVANTVASAYTQGMFENHRPFLKSYLERAVTKLKGLNDQNRDIRASYQDIAQVLVDQWVISQKEFEQASLLSARSRISISEILIARGAITRSEWDKWVQEQQSLAGYFNAHYMANLVEYSYFHLSWFLSDLNRPYPLDLGPLLHQYILNQDYDLRRQEESKAVLLRALRSEDFSLSEAAAKLLAKEMDQKMARELLLKEERLPERVQGPLLKRAIALLPESEAGEWHKKVIQRRRATPLMSDAICALYPKDPVLCGQALEDLLRGKKEEPILLGLRTLRFLPLPSYKAIIREYVTSDRAALRQAAWEAMEGFDFTPEERMALLSRGLEDRDEAIRVSALKLFPVKEVSDLKRFLLDPSTKVREIALRKISRLRIMPLQLLAELDFSHRDYLLIAALRSVEEAPLDPEGARALLVWGIDHCKRLQALKQSAVNGKRYQKAILAILDQEIAAWRGIFLRGWLSLEAKREWEKLLTFVDHPEPTLREYAREILRRHAPAPLQELLSESNAPISLQDTAPFDSIYSSAHPLLRALILFGLRSSIWTLSDQSRKKIRQMVQADRSPLIQEEIRFLNDFKEDAMTEREPEAQPHAMTSVEKILLLKSVDLFREVPVEKLLSLADPLSIRECAPGEAIVTQGEVGDALFVIVSGQARVEKRVEDGRTVPIAEIGEGEAFGEMSILDRETRSATVRALEATRLLSLQGEDFRRLAKEDPEIALEMAATLSRRLRASHGASM